MRQEMREPRSYASILKAVATGRTGMSEISSARGIDHRIVSKYISALLSLLLQIHYDTQKPSRNGLSGKSCGRSSKKTGYTYLTGLRTNSTNNNTGISMR
ncbi:MAG: hypothetical protein F7B60_01900 [Desulfurococcales archaeon]|nr:hypothetical protein [Desulfurococcales archaeon]